MNLQGRIGIRLFALQTLSVTNPGTRFEIDDAIMDPTRHFSRPADVLETPSLSRDEKRRILKSWALDAELINAAESENMRGRAGDCSHLRDAKLALLTLDG